MDWLSQLSNPARLRFTKALQQAYQEAMLRRYAAAPRADQEGAYKQGIVDDSIPPGLLLRHMLDAPGTFDYRQRLQGNPWNEQAPRIDPAKPWDWLRRGRSWEG